MNKKLLVVAGLILFIGAGTSVAYANHAWSKYHWDISTEQSSTSPLKIGDNLSTAQWKSSLAEASSDWNLSVLKNQVVSGTSNVTCDPTLGQVEVCNSTYGNNGWLGIAQVWIYRGRSGHIAQGVVKLNDTYFNTPQYNTQAWRNFVACQEIGHTFGLGHQDENFSNANLGSCMDYTNDPDGSANNQLNNEHPNTHDFEMMDSMYAHLNSTDSDSGGKGNKGKKPKKFGVNVNLNDPSAWGRATKQDAQGKNSLYEKDLGNGLVLLTHVIWAENN